jgi:hypothetical protein
LRVSGAKAKNSTFYELIKAPESMKNGTIRFVEIAAPRFYFWGMFVFA